MASRKRRSGISLDEIFGSNRQKKRNLKSGAGQGTFGQNRRVGVEKMTKNQRPQDLRKSLVMKRKLRTDVVDARERITKKKRVKNTRTPQNVKLTFQVTQKANNKETQTKRSEKRSLDFSGGSLKITAKQELRSAESTADGSLLVTAKVTTNKNQEKDRTADLSEGKLSITAKSSYASRIRTGIGEDFVKSVESEALSGRLGPKNEQCSRAASTATRITVSNLHPLVTLTDIEELFGALGPLKSGRLLRQGMAEVVYVKREDAMKAYTRYHNRNLDGQPMMCKLSTLPSVTQYVPPANRPLPPLPPVAHSQTCYPTQQMNSDDQQVMQTNLVPSRPVVFKVRI